MHIYVPLLASALALAACSPAASSDAGTVEFMTRISAYCGAAYEGTVVSDDPQDESWRAQRIVANFQSCEEVEIGIPLAVGDDLSRTWVLTKGDDGRLTLRHHHNHEDGTPDALTLYGGKASETSSGSRQTFPADDQTKDLFDREAIPVSKTNVWAMEIRPQADMFAYELERPERFFRVEFDLSQPVDPVGEPW